MKGRSSLIIVAIVMILVIGGGTIAYNALKSSTPTSDEIVYDNDDENKRTLAGETDLPEETEPEQTEPEQTETEPTEEEPVDDDPMAFTVRRQDGEEVKFNSLFGKPTIVNFWTTWCPNCVVEMPMFEEAYIEYGDRVNFVMMNAIGSRGESEADAARFLSERDFTFPVYFDTRGYAQDYFELKYLPTTFFFDEAGNLLSKKVGSYEGDALMKKIEGLLADE